MKLYSWIEFILSWQCLPQIFSKISIMRQEICNIVSPKTYVSTFISDVSFTRDISPFFFMHLFNREGITKTPPKTNKYWWKMVCNITSLLSYFSLLTDDQKGNCANFSTIFFRSFKSILWHKLMLLPESSWRGASSNISKKKWGTDKHFMAPRCLRMFF